MSGGVLLLPYTFSGREQRKITLTFRANRKPAQQLGYGLDNREIDSWQGRESFSFPAKC